MGNEAESIDAGSGAIAVRSDDGNGVRTGNVDRNAVSEGAAILSMIERAARDPAVDINKMERLFEMQQQAAARRARGEFLAAFSALQAVLPPVARRGTGHNNKKYARFEDVIEAVKPHLAANGFSLSFRTERQDAAINVVGVLGHAGGHSEQTSLPLPADASGSKNNVQAWGSAISYGKRYVALTLLGIATEDEDDDGKKAGHVAADQPTVDKLKAMIAETKADTGWICSHYSVETLDDLTAKQIGDAMAGLAARKRAQKVKP